MTDWVRIDPQALSVASTTREPGRGVELTITLSPYDIPDGVRGVYDEQRGRYVIEFSYIEDEPWDYGEQDKYVRLRIGKASRRLKGVELDVDKITADSVSVRMEVPKMV